MKSKLIFVILVVLISFGCSDPCDDPDNIDCETGDIDMDGILNGEDTAPLNACIPDENNIFCPSGDTDMDGIKNTDDSSPSDPCLPQDNLACPTGDLDNDGLSNSEDSDPLVRCLPKVPDIELNIIGTWSSVDLSTIVEFKSDGTYEEEKGFLYSIFDDEVSKNWSIKKGTILELVLTNSYGTHFIHEMEVSTNKCDKLEINLVVGAGSVVTFIRS